jgi:ribonuclease BN (tRNA processing enzyme)
MVRVTVLGSGDAFGSGGRFHSAHLVEAPGATFLLDCGPTILQSLKRFGFDPQSLDFALISHLHGDHFGGVPFLLMEYRYVNPRTRPFTIAGPAGIGVGVDRLFAALYQRIAATESPFPVVYQVLPGGQGSQTLQGVQIETIVVPHVDDLTCFAYRVTVGGKTILFSGDSAWTDKFLELARGADLFQPVLCATRASAGSPAGIISLNCCSCSTSTMALSPS